MTKKSYSLVIIGWLLAGSALAEVRFLTGDANNNFYNSAGYLQDVSPDGRFVLFSASPPVSGPVPGITNAGLYLRDLVANTLTNTGATVVGGDGVISDNGRYVAWTTTGNMVCWRDIQAGVTRVITAGADGACQRPVLSADGRYVAYVSVARNLVATTNLLPAINRAAVYLYDSQSQTTTVASLTYDGKALSTGVGYSTPKIEFDFSANGQYVFFSTDATNVHPSRLALAAGYQVFYWLYRRNLTNGVVDVVCKNATNGIPLGNFTTPSVDASGNRVLFTGGIVGVYGGPLMISNYVAYINSDLYLKDMTTAEVWWVSKTTNGTTPDASFTSGGQAISADGKVVAFGSTGAKFVLENTDPFDNSDPWDLFRVDIGPSGSVTNTLISKPYFGTTNVSVVLVPCLTSNGSYVAFTSLSQNGLTGTGPLQGNYHGYGVGTLPSAVVTPPPLKFSTAPGQLTLAWPVTAGVSLYFKTNLASLAWTLATNIPTLANGTNIVILSPTGGPRFFTLRSP